MIRAYALILTLLVLPACQTYEVAISGSDARGNPVTANATGTRVFTDNAIDVTLDGMGSLSNSSSPNSQAIQSANQTMLEVFKMGLGMGAGVPLPVK